MRWKLWFVALALASWVCAWSPARAQVPVVPIAGDTPNVVLGLTNQEHPDDLEFTIVNSSSPSGTLPLGGAAHYEIATFDTGASVHIISHEAYLGFGVGAAGLNGAYETGVGGGGGGSVFAIASDPLGVYVTGLQEVTAVNPALAINTSTLRGQYNTSILYAQAGDALPTLIGTPLSSQYTTLINYGNPQLFEHNGVTHRSPEVSLQPLGSVAPPARRIGLTLYPGPLGSPPGFFPSLDNFDDFHDNPLTPTVAGTFFLEADVNHNGHASSNIEMILDTGAQGTIFSEARAADLGISVAVDPPDFVVRIAGVTGTAEEVPGYYIDELTFNTTAGDLTLTNVPIIVFNLTDPRDGQNVLDGLVGMNLFSDRNLVLNPQPGNPYLGVSDPALPTHTWNAPSLNGTWATATNWSANGTPALNWIAQVVNPAGQARNANVHADSQVNYLHVRGDGAAMDLRLDNGSTLTVFSAAIIEDDGFVTLLDDSTLDALAVELRGGTLRGDGTVVGEVISQGTLAPGHSAGTITFDGSFDQLLQGVMEIELGGAAPGTQHDQVIVTGLVSLGGTLDVSLIDGFSPVFGQTFTILTAQDIDGQFDTVLSPFDLDVIYNPTSVVLRSLVEVFVLGDFNLDGQLTNTDIQAMLDALVDLEGYKTTHGLDDEALAAIGDINGDTNVTNTDIQALLDLLTGGDAQTVPEPASVALLILGLAALRRRRVH